MGSEEVLSVRAGLHPRAKRRGQDRVNPRQSGRNFVENGGSSGNGGLGAVQAHMEGHQHAPSRSPIQHKKSNSHGGSELHNKRSNRQHQRSASAAVATVAGRSTDNISKTGGWGGSSIGAGGTRSGDGSVGHAVHMAAVESVEVFLGDFVPTVAQPPAVAALFSAPAGAGAEEKGGVGGGPNSVGGAVVKKLSKWAAIGRGGKISARATAVCVDEVRVRISVALHPFWCLVDASIELAQFLEYNTLYWTKVRL